MKKSTHNQWSVFFSEFSTRNELFVQHLSRDYPRLSSAEFRLCCYLRAGYSSRDIAEKTDRALRSIESGRYRLRKKLPIQSHEDLGIFLMKI